MLEASFQIQEASFQTLEASFQVLEARFKILGLQCLEVSLQILEASFQMLEASVKHDRVADEYLSSVCLSVCCKVNLFAPFLLASAAESIHQQQAEANRAEMTLLRHACFLNPC